MDLAAQGKRGRPVQQVAANHIPALYEAAEALKLSSRGLHGMNDPAPLRVLVGVSRLPSDPDQATLIVNAENEQLDELRQQLNRTQSAFPVVLSQAVLAGSHQAEVVWFRYNDSRLNGIIGPERWKLEYPNIQLDRQEIIQATTLSQILNEWPAANDGKNGIDLTLTQCDPIEALCGAGEWLQRIERIQLQGPRVNILWEEACNAWLQQRGYRRDPQVQLGWVRDPVAAQLMRQQAEIETLRQQHESELKLHARRQQELVMALRHVFPYTAYREKRPDMATYKDEDLLNHFVVHGIREGVDLQFSGVQSELQQLRAGRADDASRLELLASKSRQTAQHLELLKEMFTRLMVNP